MKKIIILLLTSLLSLNSVCQKLNLDSLFKKYTEDSIIGFSSKNVFDTVDCKHAISLAHEDYKNGKCRIPFNYYLSSTLYNWPVNRKWFAFLPDQTLTRLFEEKCGCTLYRPKMPPESQLFYDRYIDEKLRNNFGDDYMISWQNESNILKGIGLGFIPAKINIDDSILTECFKNISFLVSNENTKETVLIALKVNLKSKVTKTFFLKEYYHNYIKLKKMPREIKLFANKIKSFQTITSARFKGKTVDDTIYLLVDMSDNTVNTQ